ncbi:Ankyrin repeats (3 copies) [Planctomycetes bacterium MalM25]|nr:Ankyrin repeats (3 copies) [Planctomycetes bacterium MalM25]
MTACVVWMCYHRLVGLGIRRHNTLLAESITHPTSLPVSVENPVLNSKLCLVLTLVLITGCGWGSPQSKIGWKIEDYFDDPSVIELCRAIESDNLVRMKSLVDQGVDINTIGKHGMTPLMWSFPNKRIDCFRWLLEQGADPNVCLTGTVTNLLIAGRSVTYAAVAAKEETHYPLVLKHGGTPTCFARIKGSRFSSYPPALLCQRPRTTSGGSRPCSTLGQISMSGAAPVRLWPWRR